MGELKILETNCKYEEIISLSLIQTVTGGCVNTDKYGIVLYCVFILSAISPYTTGLKALFNPSDFTGTTPTQQVTDIPLIKRQRLKDDHLSTSLRFFIPQVAILRTCPNMTLAVERDVKP